MPSASIAVIDIGSNSIKVLLASRTPDGSLTALMMRTLEARISAGISQACPRLGEQGIVRGLAAIQSLVADTAAYAPSRTVLVATSAVRDAANRAEFCERVRTATGRDIRILSGEEEASLIGRGLLCDPLPSHLQGLPRVRSRRRQPRVPGLHQPANRAGGEPAARLRETDRESLSPTRPRHSIRPYAREDRRPRAQ